MINPTFDFRSDTPRKKGSDPDKDSPTLHAYHQALWSKPLPSGRMFDLVDARPKNYLVHESDLGRFRMASDTVVPSFRKRGKQVVAQLNDGELEAFNALGYTIGGMMIFPASRVDGKMTINGARGFHRRIADRFDLTVECIRRHYAGEASPLGDTLARYASFFDLFESFEGYVDFFLLQDIVDDTGGVRFAMPFDDFTTPAVPGDLETYRAYMHQSMEFLRARCARMVQSVG